MRTKQYNVSRKQTLSKREITDRAKKLREGIYYGEETFIREAFEKVSYIIDKVNIINKATTIADPDFKSEYLTRQEIEKALLKHHKNNKIER